MSSQYTRIRKTNATNVNIRQHGMIILPHMNSRCMKESNIPVKSVVINQVQRVISLNTGSPFMKESNITNCNSCDYQVKYKSILTGNKQSVQEGKKYQYKDGSLLFISKSQLTRH